MREETDFEEGLKYCQEDQYVEIEEIDNLNNHIKLKVKGLEKTVYEGGTFIFEIITPNDYPFRPPYVYCHTRIWHPNINNSIKVGRLNSALDLVNPVMISKIDSFGRSGWTPSKTLSNLIYSLKMLVHLKEPIFNINEALSGEVRTQFLSEIEEFEQQAKYFTKQYATEDQIINFISVEEVQEFFKYKPFILDPTKTIGQLKREHAQLDISGAFIKFIYKGKVLPDDKSLEQLGIDPKEDNIAIMKTHLG